MGTAVPAEDLPANIVPADDLPDVAAVAPAPSLAAQYGSAFIRPVVKAITGIPGIFADAATAAGNIATGHVPLFDQQGRFNWRGYSDNGAMQFPSQATNEALDKYTVAPTGVGRVAEGMSTALLGSRIPNPSFAPEVPANFIPGQQGIRNAVVSNAQDLGYQVQPKVANPTFLNRVMGSIAGTKVGAGARINNEEVTQEVANRALGQNPEAPITAESLAAVRQKAFQSGYVPVRNAGQMATDQQFSDSIDKLIQNQSGVNRSFPGLAPDNTVSATLEKLKQPSFDSGDAVDAISHLRDLSSQAFAAGQNAAGSTYKSAAKALEGVIERNLGAQGENGAKMLQDFRNARQTIALAHDLGGALEGGTVRLSKLAAMDSPFTGDLKTAVDFARNFKSAARTPSEADFDVASQLDILGGFGAGALSGNALPMALPFTRLGMSRYLLSRAGQQNALAAPAGSLPTTIGLPGSVAGLAFGR